MGKPLRNGSLLCEPLEPRELLFGVTLITHGFNSGIGDWVRTMANAISDARPTPASIYAVRAADDGGSGSINVTLLPGLTGPTPSAADNPDPEIVLLLDWSQVAGTLPFGGHTRATGEVAAAVAGRFADPSFLPTLLGHPLAELPIHLIGHSRGGSLVNALARELGTRGIWVDQLTTLDPHPVDGLNGDFFDWGDAPMAVPENVIFADNYWRADADIFDFDGEVVPGAHDLRLTESVLDNGGYAGGHSDVHLWYHGTIPPYPASDGGASVGNNWYSPPHPARDATGFHYSRTIGGTRPQDGLWPAYGGTGPRAGVLGTGTQWPNIDRVALEQPASGTISIGEQISLSYWFADRDGGATITWFTDSDANPYNGHLQQLPNAAGVNGASPTRGLYQGSTAGLSPRTVRLFARVDDADGNSRSIYAPGSVTLTDAAPPVASDPQFVFTTSPPRVTVQFSRDVAASLAPTDLLVERLPSGTVFNPQSVSYDSTTNITAFVFSGLLPDGNYRATLPAGSVSSGGGVALASDVVFDFFVFAGDVNRDRVVNFDDLAVLAQHYNTAGKTFDQGDFNYDGLVNFDDLALLAQRYNTSLPPPVQESSRPPASAPALLQSPPAPLKKPLPKKSFGTRRIA